MIISLGSSPELQGAIVGGFIALAGSFGALLMNRYLRERGELQCEINAWVHTYANPGQEARDFEVRFFNNKDVSTALWNIRVEFFKDDALSVSLNPKNLTTGAPIEELNMPSRVTLSWVMRLQASEDAEEHLRQVQETDRSEFVGTIPGGKEFRREMVPWKIPR
jgi:hypothetical protein